MTAEASVRNTDPALETLQSLDAAMLASLDRAGLARVLAPAIERLKRPMTPEQSQAMSQATLRVCQQLHLRARSGEGLPLLYALLEHARAAGNALLERHASSACGIHCADIGDPVAGIEHQVDALRLAGCDRVAAGRAWNNIGLAMSIAGHSAMATRCYERSLNVLEGSGAADVRYSVLSNLAQSQLDTGYYEEGLVSAHLALLDEAAVLRRNPMDVLRLRRNLVRLLVAVGRVDEAEPHVLDAGFLAQQVRTPRAAIAAALTQAVYDLAKGDADVGLTRLDTALAAAREVPGALRDALACVVRAEELAGHSERALLRLSELSDVVYGPAVAAARQHIELASIAEREGAGASEAEQARARLIAKLAEPGRPDGWAALERLGVTACIRIEPTGLHGKRVAALAKALAQATGSDPLRALEIGFACELHDIGMVSVPEELTAKRAHDEIERAIVERHVRAGAEILSDDEHPRIFLAREVVRYHHAHWDGSGHPEGVAGTRIPLAARICAVADAYDDLLCGTRGAPRQTMDQALRHLRTQAGRRYDPELVDRFESMIRTETEDLGLDLSAAAGMDNFQQLVSALQEDRGFV